MTADEAKTKWCPMTRVGSRESIDGTNRDWQDRDIPAAKCIASDCMVWQWDLFQEQVDKYNPMPHGHCGLLRL